MLYKCFLMSSNILWNHFEDSCASQIADIFQDLLFPHVI